jgi:NADH-quinone oxidoreductase subunit N
MTILLTHPLGLVFAMLPEVVLTVFGLVALLVAAWRHRTEADSRLVGWVAVTGVLAAMAALGWLWLNGARPEGPVHMVVLDDFRFAVAGLILLATLATLLLSLGYLTREQLLAPEFHPLVLFAAAGMLWLAGADDMIVLFLGLELMSVAAYVLTAFNRRSVFSAEAGLKYFLTGAFASAFLLYGIALLYGATGQTSLAAAGALLSRGPLPLMAGLGLGLFLIGFAFKVAAVPFHMWAPDAYEGAPTPVTGFMATGVKVAAFAALARLLFTAFPTAVDVWQPVVAGLAVATMVVGNLVALVQRSLKRMLAYSSVAHAGYLLASLVPAYTLGVIATLVYLFAYTITTLAVFGLLAVLGRDGEREVTLDTLAGLAGRRPWVAAGLSVGMLSLLGFPGTIGFIGKWQVLLGLLGQEHYALAVVVVLTTLVAAGYYLPVIMAAYMRPATAEAGAAESPLPGPAAAVVGLATAGVVALGIWPIPVINTAVESARSLFEGIMSAVHIFGLR